MTELPREIRQIVVDVHRQWPKKQTPETLLASLEAFALLVCAAKDKMERTR